MAVVFTWFLDDSVYFVTFKFLLTVNGTSFFTFKQSYFWLYLCVCVCYVCSDHGDQTTELDPLGWLTWVLQSKLEPSRSPFLDFGILPIIHMRLGLKNITTGMLWPRVPLLLEFWSYREIKSKVASWSMRLRSAESPTRQASAKSGWLNYGGDTGGIDQRLAEHPTLNRD